ncbi:hypothetical protein BACCOP_00602 [Phocaeicola coprocola DSM 17136]|uniref:Uncharacterized protein n=1 Tax=Phocaeicola coprocola DSM 17136 TaxID=470145 RepID=B3JFF3_9BACT|nr:hypothetical protein BACCOP_00602 [Phocaeicola coprocola DSM 17136]
MRGRKTKVGRKLLRFPPTRLFVTFIGKVKLFYFSENIKSNERNIS